MKRFVIQKTSITGILALLLIIVLPVLLAERVEAAGFQQAEVRIDRMTASTFASGMVCVKTPVTHTATEAFVVVVFPSDFTISTTLTDWAVSTANILPSATIWPGIGQATAANNSTHTVTFPSTVLTGNTQYCFQWTNNTAALQTGLAGVNKTGTVTTTTSVPANIDTSAYATAIVSSGNDQIGVSATVPATFTFTLSGTTDTLGTLSTSVASSAGKTVTIATNAAAGWVAWVKSANAALNSVSTGASVATAGSLDNTPSDLAGMTGYVLNVAITTDSATGTGAVSQATNYGAEYVGNSTSGGTLSTIFQPIASSTGTTDGDVLTLVERAKISAVQAAAPDYADTLTIVAAGRF